MGLQAYQKTQKTVESAKNTEYRLFAQVTRALMEASELEKTDPKVIDALSWNRKLWNTLARDCAMDENRLPDEVRAGIISLSIWVNKHSSEVMREGGDIADLIEINRSIMEGLAASPAAS